LSVEKLLSATLVKQNQFIYLFIYLFINRCGEEKFQFFLMFLSVCYVLDLIKLRQEKQQQKQQKD